MAIIAGAMAFIMIAQISGSFIGAQNAAQKAGQQQCKIKGQIGQYNNTLNKLNNLLNDAKKESYAGAALDAMFKGMDGEISTMRQNELDKQDEIISDYKKEIKKLNIISLSFTGTVFIIMLISCIMRYKRPVNC